MSEGISRQKVNTRYERASPHHSDPSVHMFMLPALK